MVVNCESGSKVEWCLDTSCQIHICQLTDLLWQWYLCSFQHLFSFLIWEGGFNNNLFYDDPPILGFDSFKFDETILCILSFLFELLYIVVIIVHINNCFIFLFKYYNENSNSKIHVVSIYSYNSVHTV